MLGIEDPWVWLAYILCILSTLLCVVYGIVTWNKGDEEPSVADSAWAGKEDKIEQDL